MWEFRKTIRATDFWNWLFWRSGRWDGILGFWFWSLLHNLPQNLLTICPFHLVFPLRPISHAYPRRKCRPWPRKSEVQTSLRERGGGDHWGGSPCSAPLGFTTCAVHSPYVPPRTPFPHSGHREHWPRPSSLGLAMKAPVSFYQTKPHSKQQVP